MAQIGKFTVPDAKKIAEATRRTLSGPRMMLAVPERVSRGSNNGPRIRDAELTSSMSAASNSKTGATTATAKFLVPNPNSPGNLMDGDTFTVTNRSLDATGLSGDYLIVARIGAEWRPIWVDC